MVPKNRPKPKKGKDRLPTIHFQVRDLSFREGTLQGTYISHLGNRKIIDSNVPFKEDMLLSSRLIGLLLLQRV